MKITGRLLKSKGACADQVAKFAELFPNGVEPTEALCLAHAQVFDWRWASDNLLSASAWKAYGEAHASAKKAYDEAIAPAEKAYDEVVAPARKAYDEAVASAFGRIVEEL